MSRDRDTEYKFVSTDTEELVAAMVSAYETIVGETVHPASREKLFIQWMASIIVQERVLMNYIGNQNIPSSATGENLDRLAELVYIQERPDATAASCTMRFYISEAQESAVLVPAGTRVTDNSAVLYWTTDEDVYIAAGDLYADVSATCTTTGTDGNGYAIGQLTKLVDLYDYYTACENITETDGGSDVPTDDEFYELMRQSMDAWSTAGAKGSYIYWAKTVSTEIADVVANSPAAGEVYLYAIMDDGTIATEETKAAIYEACNADERRPLTDYVTVADPDISEYSIDLTYYVPADTTTSSAEITEQVEAAVETYISWQSGKLGRDINPSYLVWLLMQTGIKRVEIRSPTFTVLRDGILDLGKEYEYAETVPELAQVTDITIISGGYEDE